VTVQAWFGWLCRWTGFAWCVASVLLGAPAIGLPLGGAMIGLGSALSAYGPVVGRDPDALSPNPPGWAAAVAEYMADPHATPEQLEARWMVPDARVLAVEAAILEACECGPLQDSGCAPSCRVCAAISGRGAYHSGPTEGGMTTRGEWR
jgi:hypothetical protein